MSFNCFDLIPSAICPMGLHPRHARKLDRIKRNVARHIRTQRRLQKWLRRYNRERVRAVTTTRDLVAADLYLATWQMAGGYTMLENVQRTLDSVKRWQ